MNSTPPVRKTHPLGLLHRHGGMIAALLVIVICITGIMLNHTDALKLDQRSVNAHWLLNWYGIEAPETKSFAVGENFIIHSGNALLFNETQLQGRYADVVGAVSINNTLVVAVDNALLLLTSDGKLIEQLQAFHGIPADIKQIGTSANKLWLQTATGQWQADSAALNWVQAANSNENIVWATPVTLPVALEESIMATQIGAGLSLERIILDLHSGQIIGRAGPLLGDAVGALFILLALSGIWMWFKTRRRNQ
jgi:hypothetical protein